MSNTPSVNTQSTLTYLDAIPPIIAVTVVIAEVFLVLATLQVLPAGVNAISQLDPWYIAAIGVAIASPLLLSIPIYCRKKVETPPLVTQTKALSELEQDIEIPNELIGELQAKMPFIQENAPIINRDLKLWEKELDGMHFYESAPSHRIFGLDSAPEFIFKTDDPLTTRTTYGEISVSEHYKNLVKAKQICMNHQLDQIVIPHTAKVRVGAYDVLVQQKLTLVRHPGWIHASDESIRQLAVFICETGFTGIELRNIHLWDGAIGLHDLQEMHLEGVSDDERKQYAKVGLFGGTIGEPKKGLFDCVAQNQQHIVIEVAKQYGISVPL